MSYFYSNSALDDLKSQINIVDVIGRTVSLKKSGTYSYKALCPFHNEKTPSFSVSEDAQFYHCFGCGAAGDVIKYTMQYYNLDFNEAVAKLAEEYGITIERRNVDQDREDCYKVNQMAARFFYRAFTESPNKGYAYMKRRGITPATMKKFGLGYADEAWDSLYRYLLSEGVSVKLMLELGLISERNGRYYDKFRNRVIFPIINTAGKVIGFGGRAINPDDNPKYLNSPESKVFLKKNNLYGLNISRRAVGKENYIILVEGYMDVIALYQSGVENVAASLGTALTENQARLIKRYTREVILSYDADQAGRKAALRGMDILKAADCKVKVLHVTDGKDPDEYIKKNGKQAFLELVQGALPFGDYKLESAKAGFDLTRDEDKIDYLRKSAEILRQLGPVEQDIYIKKLSQELKVAEGAIRREVDGMGGTEPQRRTFVQSEQETKSEENSSVTMLERTLLKVLITEHEYISKLSQYPGILESPFAVTIYNALADEYEQTGDVDLRRVLDSLSVSEAGVLQEIAEQTGTGGRTEVVFDDCIKTWKQACLKKEEEHLIALLSLADEENNQEKIMELTNQLMEVQKKRKIQQ